MLNRGFIGLTVVLALATSVAAQAQSYPGKRQRRPGDPLPVTSAPSSVFPPTAAPSEGRLSYLKWEAYVDLEARFGGKDTLSDRGFTVNDAAFYMTKDFGNRVKGLIELPFYSDLTVPAGSGNLVFGTHRAQANLELERWAPFYMRAGQYNTYLGVEANDSRERFFADLGVIKSLLFPRTHTGVQAGYRHEELTFLGQIANPDGHGTMAGANPELGFFGRYDTGIGHGAVGFSIYDSKSAATENKTNMILDLTGGWTSGKLKFDGEIDFVRSAGSDKTGNALGFFGAYSVDQALSFGGRFEYLKDVLAAPVWIPSAVYETITELGVGPSYKLQPDLTLRGDLSVINFKAATVDESVFAVSASVVAEF